MPVSKKWDVSFGMGYTNMFHNFSDEGSSFSSNSQYGSLYISGTYHVNENFSLKGTGYKTFLLNPDNFTETNENPYLDFSNQGFILDMEYRVTDQFRINASFHYREQNYPGFYGYPHSGYSSPGFHTDGFGGYRNFSPGF